jgi:type VI secretion system protein ImpE
MTAEELIRAGKPAEALVALQQEVRANPADGRLRIFLFQLLSVLGKWDKALAQLAVLRDLDAASMLLAQIFTPAIQCELIRKDVFTGTRSPLIFGEPEEWLGLLVQANQLVAEGQFAAAAEVRTRAFDAAPATSGTMNDEPCSWIADADSRLGPVLEAIVDGKYYWVPFSRIQSVRFEPPTDLRNLVWTPAQFVWANGGAGAGLIPTRYPGSESSDDPALQLARKTVWQEHPGETFLGLGQRTLATDNAELPLHEVKSIDLQSQVLTPEPDA